LAKAKAVPAGQAAHVHYELRDASPAAVRQLRQNVMGCHWQYQQQILEILEWVCGTDRQYVRARRLALDLINGEERALVAIIARTFAPPQENDDAASR
jgi:hypothetical protein